jgi:UDP-N-acetylmuramoyl-L-alanyl-D-glutamate--2,6-diaminopimelate ligase
VLVTGITHDSREVRPGDMYAGIAGAQVHGARFAPAAVAAGAVALVTDANGALIAAEAGVEQPVLVVPDPRAALGPLAARVYGHPDHDLTLIGVTGTNGKTTTSFLLEAGLRAAGRRTGLIGTVQTQVGDEVLASARTTPEATELQALFAVMRERGVDAVAMEVSSHALVLGRVAGTTFDVAVFTNLSQDHLDFHTDMGDYFSAKGALFVPGQARRAVINVDGGYGARLSSMVAIPVVTVSPGGATGADWWAEDVRLGPDGSTFDVRGPEGVRARASVRLPGDFNVANALLALVALVEAKVPLADAVEGVAACPGVPGRMERVEAGQAFLAVVDYAHTPDAVATILRSLRPVTKGRLIAVLGCGGDRDHAKRPLMAATAARLCDVAVFTSDNPRSEDPVAIIEEMRAGLDDVPAGHRADVLVLPDRREAVAEAVRLAGPDDVVAVLGKGHEQGQEIAGEVRPFDDRVELRAAIEQVGR